MKLSASICTKPVEPTRSTKLVGVACPDILEAKSGRRREAVINPLRNRFTRFFPLFEKKCAKVYTKSRGRSASRDGHCGPLPDASLRPRQWTRKGQRIVPFWDFGRIVFGACSGKLARPYLSECVRDGSGPTNLTTLPIAVYISTPSLFGIMRYAMKPRHILWAV